MVYLIMKRLKSLGYVSKVHDPFSLLLQGATDMHLNSERMAMHL